jgi:hypothetical protein
MRSLDRARLSQNYLQALRPGAFADIRDSAQQLMRIAYREGLAQQESLRILAIVLLQEKQLRKTLHSLGRYANP